MIWWMKETSVAVIPYMNSRLESVKSNGEERYIKGS